MSSSLVGRTLGKYKVTELLGQGGMATVYKGYQEDIERYVAIKVLPPHPGLDAQFIRRFQLEARTIARLQHPHILPLYDYGTEDDILYLVMAYIEGGTLADWIDRGPMEPAAVERTLREIASALDYAHRQGVVHRDIKPGNILLDSEGHALLADFGIVKLSEGGANLTGTGVVGTPAYMAPEQAQGIAVDGRTDIYSLGVVVYEMLTGRQPYSGDTPMQVLIKHMQEPVPSVRATQTNLPPALDQVLKKAMAKASDDRYQTAVEFAEDFTRALHQHDDSRTAARTAVPLDTLPKTAPAQASETQFPQPTMTPGLQTTTQPTIVVQGAGSNPLVLLGGFAIIAIVIVAVVVLLIGSRDNNSGGDQSTPVVTIQQVAEQATHTPAPTVIAVPRFGTLRFSTSGAPGDTIQLQVEGLGPLSNGQIYAAWLVNTADGSALSLGKLTLDAFGTGALIFPDPKGYLLGAWFNAITITAEESVGATPTGEVRYSGSVPPELMLALRQILVVAISENAAANTQPMDGGYGEMTHMATASSPTDMTTGEFDALTYDTYDGSGESLLTGALAEAATAKQHSGLAADATNAGGMHTHAEHTINILLGTQDDYNGNGRGENPGRGIGVVFYLDRMESLLEDATASASLNVQAEAELIRVCTNNVRLWTEQVVDLEKQLLATEDIGSVVQQKADSTALTDAIVNGVDLNQNAVVEPFEGECGLRQIETFGVAVASVDIVEGPLATE